MVRNPERGLYHEEIRPVRGTKVPRQQNSILFHKRNTTKFQFSLYPCLVPSAVIFPLSALFTAESLVLISSL